MTLPSPREVLLADPVSEVTRRERRALLGSSIAAILIAKTGLIPSKIDALGIELSSVNQNTLLIILSLVVTYFFFAFLIYGAMEVLSWRHAYQEYLIERALEVDRVMSRGGPEEDPALDDVPNAWWIYRWSTPVAFVRLFFEFGLPVLVAIYAIYSLVEAAVTNGT